MSVLLRGGRVVTADSDFTGDVLVVGEQVAALGTRLQVSADQVVDARGRWVIPGGIDPHVHLDMRVGTLQTSDDFATGTAAAAAGGTTTVIDFANQEPGRSLLEAWQDWRERADRAAVVDYGLHVTITDLPPERVGEVAELVALGTPTFKMFMAYPGRLYTDDRTRFRAYRAVAAAGGTVLMHAENGLVIDELVAEAAAAGHLAPPGHARTRPVETAVEAIDRSAALARLAGVGLYVVHMNCAQGVEALRRARAAGTRAWGETCPQYLFLDDSRLEGDPDRAAGYVCSPPLRPPGHGEALWEALLDGTLDTVGTDHAPFDLSDRRREGTSDFRRIANGLPGVEHRMSLLFHGGVVQRGMSPQRFVHLASSGAARAMGLFPRKGTLAPGSDADVVVWDPGRRVTLSAATHHSAADYCAYEGLEVQGAPELVLSRGRVVFRDGEVLARGGGRYLERVPAGRTR